MALATRCPHCQTAFRVASDQLKLRAGLVRCGTCKEIFNGIENLLHPDEDIIAATAVPTPAIPTVEESVIATRHFRGDETRFNDLIAEVDRPESLASSASSALLRASTPAATRSSPPHPAPSDAPEANTEADAAADTDALRTDDTDRDHLLANAQDAADPLPDTDGSEPPEEKPDHPDHDAPEASPLGDVDADDADDADEVDDADEADVAGDREDEDADTVSDPDLAASTDFTHLLADDGSGAAPNLPSLLRTAAVAGDEPTAATPRPTARPAASAKKARKQPVAPPAPTPSQPDPADQLPDFVTREEEREDRHRTRRPLMIGAAVLLVLAILAQGLYAGRTALAASFPPLRPALDQACRIIGCTVGLPMQIESVSIESSDFQPVPGRPDQFLLSVLLRNRSSTVQAWPTIELTLNDATDKAVGRRLIAPRDYLPSGQTGIKGFSAGSEQAVRLVFDLSRLKASGYRVYVFYP